MENIPRSLPESKAARLTLDNVPLTPLFRWLQRQGGISASEMVRTFNCGIGMVLVVAREHVEQIKRLVGEPVVEFGTVVEYDGGARVQMPGLESWIQ